MSREAFSAFAFACIALVSFGALPAAASTISPFSDHSDEDHSNESHSGEFLEGVNLTLSDLSGSDFSFTNLSNSLMDDADLSNLSLVGANLADASITGSDASNSDFSGANLSGVDFTGTELSDAVFTGATYDVFTVFEPGFDPGAVGMNLIPEPSTASLLALSLLALGCYGRKRPRTIPAT